MDYKEKLELAKDWYNDQSTTKKEKVLLENLFPELKVSEDEIVISALKSGIKFLESEYKIEGLGGLYFKKILAWLEKQGEKYTIIDIDKMVKEYSQTRDGDFGLPMNCMIRAYRKGINDALRLSLNLEKQGGNNRLIEEIKERKELLSKEKEKAISTNDRVSLGGRIAMLEELLVFANEKQGEQKSDKVEPKFHKGDIIIHKELGGDYIHNSHKIIQVDILDKEYRLEGGLVAHFSEEDDYELVEQKSSWSEEDEDAIGMAIEALEDLCDVDDSSASFIGHHLSFDEAIQRLKCLKPQPHWKPTEEQIHCFKCVIDFYKTKVNDTIVLNLLNSLYNELVKL